MINVQAPINAVSFGFCALNILERFHRLGEEYLLFPVGNQLDFGCFDRIAEVFRNDLIERANASREKYFKTSPGFKLWHIHDAENSVSKENTLFTFYELDSPTKTEVNILNNQKNVLVSSLETQKVLIDAGVKVPVIYCPLGFDSNNFFVKKKQYYPPHVTVFGLFGKFEKRKHHAKVIQAWVKKFGGRKDCVLHTHIYNPHIQPEGNNQILSQLFGNNKPFNVNCIPYVRTLSELNECYNAVNVVIDMSGGEGFSLPSFHCLAMGKHAVIHNCSAMKDWANDKNAVLVEPSGKEPVYDGMFFHPNQPYNQGNIYSWDEEEFIAACETAMARYQSSPINQAGLLLQEQFTWSNTADIILKAIKN